MSKKYIGKPLCISTEGIDLDKVQRNLQDEIKLILFMIERDRKISLINIRKYLDKSKKE